MAEQLIQTTLLLTQEYNIAPLNQCPIAWQAQLNPDIIAIETEHESLSYLQLHHHLHHLSLQLKKQNVKKGDRVVSIYPNSLAVVLMQLTCLRNGFVFCPINPQFTKDEIEQRITLLNSHFIWQEDRVKSLLLRFDSPEKQGEQQPLLIDEQAVISIIFTSGSSGNPKGVMHHFSNHYYSALGSQAVIPLKRGDKNLLSLPLFHISGYATVMRTMLAGATLRLASKKLCVNTLKKQQITHLSLVNSQLQKLLHDKQFQQEQLSIKHLLLGGSAFPKRLLQATHQRGFTYHLSYGLTEMSSQVATSTNSEQLVLLPYRQLKIVDGEILLAGEARFAGYFQKDNKRGLIDKNSYFSSSDLGRWNENALTILGRKDRQFISGGENIQPEEIEKVLLTFTEVSQAYVLPINDEMYGQRPIAFIKWKNDDKHEALKTFVKNKLITFKQPVHYLVLPEQQGIKTNLQQLQKLAEITF